MTKAKYEAHVTFVDKWLLTAASAICCDIAADYGTIHTEVDADADEQAIAKVKALMERMAERDFHIRSVHLECRHPDGRRYTTLFSDEYLGDPNGSQSFPTAASLEKWGETKPIPFEWKEPRGRIGYRR